MTTHTQDQLRAAIEGLPDVAIEVADMLERVAHLNLSEAPEETVYAFRMVAAARTALIELEQAVRAQKAVAA